MPLNLYHIIAYPVNSMTQRVIYEINHKLFVKYTKIRYYISMRLFGDIGKGDQGAADDLLRMEEELIGSPKMSKADSGKGYIFIAYHWYKLGMEEEGNRLMTKMDEVCPDYFSKYLKKHMKNDPAFNELILELFIEFAFILTNKPQVWVKQNVSNL